MRVKGKQIKAVIEEQLEEQDPETGRPNNCVIVDVVFSIIKNKNASTRDRLYAIELLLTWTQSKPAQINLNADITTSPFEGIPTEKLEALKARLAEINKPEQSEGKCEKP